MHPNEIYGKSIGRGAIAVAALWAGVAFATATSSAPESTIGEPVVLAQAGPTMASAALGTAAFPAHERGVRAAAAQSPEALRRYVQRTRMIHNFYYWTYAPQ